MKNNIVKGFKVFKHDWTCRDKQYTCPGKFEENVTPGSCVRGMHFCENLADCFSYYRFDSHNKVAEVIAYGNVVRTGDKSCTNKLKIVRELTWDEVLRLVNTGKNCTGYLNTGDDNTGDYNVGNRNNGFYNAGNYNTGNRNTGSLNTGNCNTGSCNTGSRNTGFYNAGICNAGDWNIGNHNTGDWNKSSYNNGCFNTVEPKIRLFNKPSDMVYSDWRDSDARYLLKQMPRVIIEWVEESDMIKEEKAKYPTHKTTGGYLKVSDESECRQIWWNELPESKREIIRALPNFDEVIFEEITGIKVR